MTLPPVKPRRIHGPVKVVLRAPTEGGAGRRGDLFGYEEPRGQAIESRSETSADSQIPPSIALPEVVDTLFTKILCSLAKILCNFTKILCNFTKILCNKSLCNSNILVQTRCYSPVFMLGFGGCAHLTNQS